MSKTRVFTFICVLLSAILLAGCQEIKAQSTIFNIPSTDVMSENRFYIEGDFTAHLDRWEKGGFQTFGYRTVYGFRKKWEAGINFFYTRNGSTSPKELQVNLKHRAWKKEKYGLAVSVGTQFYVPLNKSAGRRVFGMLFTNASKVFKKTGETRVTGGFYTMVGANRSFGTKNGAIVGIEQPIIGKLSFTGDWFSGKNRFGYANAGFSFSFAKRQFFQVGYSFGNSGRGNNSLSAFYGYTY